MTPLPRDVRSWPEEAVEEWRERASIVYEGLRRRDGSGLGSGEGGGGEDG